MTTVLSQNPEKKAGLAEWRKRVGEEESRKISRIAASRGTAAHKLCEDFINNVPEFSKTAMPDSLAMFRSLRPVLEERLGTIYGQELALYSKKLGVAGRVDLIADWDGHISVVDFKTSGKFKRKEWIYDYFRQCSGYAAMLYEMTGIPIKNIVVAIMVENSTKPQIFCEKTYTWLPSLKSQIDLFNEELNKKGLV